MQQPLQPTTDEQVRALNEMVRALALVQRDKALADARQSMKMVREIERRYGLTPTNAKEGRNQP